MLTLDIRRFSVPKLRLSASRSEFINETIEILTHDTAVQIKIFSVCNLLASSDNYTKTSLTIAYVYHKYQNAGTIFHTKQITIWKSL